MLFIHPVQTIRAISNETGVPRDTVLKAIKSGLISACAYQSGDTWLVDTSCIKFKHWLEAHPLHPRSRLRVV
jgi:hypothetical protein